MVIPLMLAWSNPVLTHAQPSQQSLDAQGQLIADTIKDRCRRMYPDDEQQFRECATKQYDAMKAFFTKLFHYRDTMGIRSNEFKKGIACVENASPAAQEQGRKVAVEKADWIEANDCYESVLR
jgi:hypothetical protein